tara:strand:- start:1031 stop:1735 length:705 start_codon:yes stop_codon:yes gene_type:complete
MEDVTKDLTSTGNSFTQHMFKFDNDTKVELMNVGQYALVSVVPLALLVHFVESVMPELDDTKTHTQLLAEVILHIVLLLVGVYFINRLVTFMPTFSKKAYNEVSFMTLALVLILTTTKIKNKLTELTKRLEEMWAGKIEPMEDDGKKKNVVKVSQPITGMKQPAPTHQVSRADYLNQHGQMTATQNRNNMVQENGSGNNMYNNHGSGGLVGAQTPTMESFEPMAANSFGGFSSF